MTFGDLSTGEWFELPFQGGYKSSFVGSTGFDVTLSDALFFVSLQRIPLDNLRVALRSASWIMILAARSMSTFVRRHPVKPPGGAAIAFQSEGSIVFSTHALEAHAGRHNRIQSPNPNSRAIAVFASTTNFGSVLFRIVAASQMLTHFMLMDAGRAARSGPRGTGVTSIQQDATRGHSGSSIRRHSQNGHRDACPEENYECVPAR